WQDSSRSASSVSSIRLRQPRRVLFALPSPPSLCRSVAAVAPPPSSRVPPSSPSLRRHRSASRPGTRPPSCRSLSLFSFISIRQRVARPSPASPTAAASTASSSPATAPSIPTATTPPSPRQTRRLSSPRLRQRVERVKHFRQSADDGDDAQRFRSAFHALRTTRRWPRRAQLASRPLAPTPAIPSRHDSCSTTATTPSTSDSTQKGRALQQGRNARQRGRVAHGAHIQARGQGLGAQQGHIKGDGK
ncbi:hypothetical protein QBC39DRAFT_385407, partial [Podospora conica]